MKYYLKTSIFVQLSHLKISIFVQNSTLQTLIFVHIITYGF